MPDIIILPIFHRTEYLQTCLLALYQARGVQDKHLWVFQSNNAEWDVDLNPAAARVQAFAHFFDNFRFTRREKHNKFTQYPQIHPSMFSTHDALIEAYHSGAEKVYYLESDVVVTPDFFEWHDAVQADGDWTATSAWREPEGNKKPFDIEAYYQTGVPSDPTAYGDIVHGICFNRKSLEKVIQNIDWWNHKHIIEGDWQCARPFVPRCYHLGHVSEQHKAGGGPSDVYSTAVDVLPKIIPDYRTERVKLVR